MVADPGLPARRLATVQEELEQFLRADLGELVLDVSTSVVRLRPDHSLDVPSVVPVEGDDPPDDAVLVLTEIPRYDEGRPLVAQLYQDHGVAVVSCPTLGVLAPRRRLVGVLRSCAARLTGSATPDTARPEPRWSRWETGTDGRAALRARTITGGPRTVLGMVMSNDPWRTAPRLSSALAAAAAVGAFGVFYTSIWEMATYLSTARLLSIGLLAMVAMVAWLVVSNRLWDTPRREGLARIVLLYNMSTVVTLAACVLVLYLALVVAILVACAVVVTPAFMESVTGEPPGVTGYLDVAWLSAAMGVVAGGLGSSFDSETDLRRLTHGQRERQRVLTDEDDGS